MQSEEERTDVRSSVICKQIIHRDSKCLCKRFQFDIGHKAVSTFNTLDRVLGNDQPQQLQSISQRPLGTDRNQRKAVFGHPCSAKIQFSIWRLRLIHKIPVLTFSACHYEYFMQ